MPSNQTQNYQLSQWVKSDQVKMEDFNADNAKIDAALKAEADARTAADAVINQALSKKGNCTIGVFTYQGTGDYGKDHPTRIVFPRMPAAYIIIGSCLLAGRGGAAEYLYVYSGPSYANCGQSTGATWSGNTLLIWNGSDSASQANAPTTYTVIAFYAES